MDFALQKLTERVYTTPYNHETDRPALGVVVGDRAVAVIDSGNSPAHAHLLLAEMEKAGIDGPAYTVFTHSHWDHTFGANTLGAKVVCQQVTADLLREMQGFAWDDASMLERVRDGKELLFCYEHIRKEYGADRHLVDPPLGDIVFTNEIKIDLGGVTLYLRHIPNRHAADCCVVHVPEEGVLFLGDTMCEDPTGTEWFFDLEDYKRTVARIADLKADYYVNAHWDIEDQAAWDGRNGTIVQVGACVGRETSTEKAVQMYTQKHGAPSAFERELINSFAAGNRSQRL